MMLDKFSVCEFEFLLSNHFSRCNPRETNLTMIADNFVL
jgi:hypothetical protein